MRGNGPKFLCPCGCENEVASEEEFYSDECREREESRGTGIIDYTYPTGGIWVD